VIGGRRVAPAGPAVACALLAGATSVQVAPALPPVGATLVATATLVLLWAWRAEALVRVPVVFVLGAAWAAHAGSAALALRLPVALEGAEVEVEGFIDGLPRRGERSDRFELAHATVQVGTRTERIDGIVRLAVYDERRALVPGQRVRAIAKLKRPRGTQNPGGFDFERFALQQRVAATGYVRAWLDAPPARPAAIDGLRLAASGWIAREVRDARIAGLLRALAVGDQGAIDDRDWDVLRATGTTHLIAISGFHVGVVAGLAALLAGLAFRIRPALALRVPRRQGEAAGALLGAIGYSLLAGMSLPVLRTLLMLAVLLGAQLGRRALGPASGLALALVALLAFDPLAVLSAGFWLSFVGVAWLMFCLGGESGRPRLLPTFGRAQVAMAIGLLPLTAWFFQQGAVAGPLANLAAVPVVSLLVVPLLLLAVLLHVWLPLLAGALLGLAAWLLAVLWRLLEALASLPWAQAWLPEPGGAALLLALVGALLLLLPRAVPGRALGLLLFAPLLLPARDAPVRGGFDVVVIDVGQGLSVLVRTARHALLYDAGAAPPGGLDQGEAAVVPAVRALGVRRLDALVLSHDDNDHAGGGPSVIAALRPRRILSGSGTLPGVRCAAGMVWHWDGVRFELLHPPASFPEVGNDASCVLRIASGAASALLPGDLSADMERRLVREGRVAPVVLSLMSHHGSANSSSPEFLDALRPRVAVASAGYRSRFGHPAPAALARHEARGVTVEATVATGALAFRFAPDGSWRRLARRETVRRYWHEPAVAPEPVR
jgi:competence protein ComEC